MAARGMQVPTYAYAENNPLRYVDLTGLSPQERAAILQQFDAAVNRMTWDAQRLDASYLNNIAASVWWKNELKGCGEQADFVKKWLSDNVAMKDYRVELAGGRTGPYGLFPHQWVVASSVADDSVLVLDPWANQAWETSFFPDSASFDYSNHPLKGGKGQWIFVGGVHPSGSSSGGGQCGCR